MPLKPHPFDSKRREERRKVTLIAGLVCRDSIVFAADSEESGGIRKTSVEKMRHIPERGMIGVLSHDPKKYTSVVVSGAGNAALCDYAMQRITDMVRSTTGMGEALTAIQNILIDIFKVHAPLLPVSDPMETDFRLLIGLRSPDLVAPYLYSTQGTTIVRRDKYFTWGSGSVTDYILDQMYSEPMSIEDGVAAVLYMLQIAKKYVSGVGGKSHISILKSDGQVDDKPPWEISEEENIATNFSQATGTLLLSLLRTRSGTETSFKNHLKMFGKNIRHLRKNKKASDRFMDEFMQHLEEQKAQEAAGRQ